MTILWAALLACLLAPSAFAQTLITTPTLIAVTNLAFENQSLVVSGTTLTIEGTHQFQNLVLTNGAILTHPTNTPTPPHLILVGNVSIAADSAIDLDGRGHEGSLGAGAGLTESCCTAGGSYGGGGGFSNSDKFSRTHGSIFEPTVLGSGGGNASSYGDGGNGGGAIRISSEGDVHLAGRLSANGTPGGVYAGGGSGGSIWIQARDITGTGMVTAHGGQGAVRAGGGGGGRIALQATRILFSGELTACGAGAEDEGTHGGAGTIFQKLDADPLGTVTIDNCGQLEGTTDFDPGFVLNANLLLRRGGKLAHRSGEGPAVLEFNGDVTLESDGFISVTGRGFPTSEGPGATRPLSCCTSGGSHAGTGGFGDDGDVPPGSTYGSIMEPFTLGSGGGNATSYGEGGAGGGALQLIFHRTLRNDGQIEANGTAGGTFAGGGSGGSLWISATQIMGTGTFAAIGGNATTRSGGGGGGRIALHYAEDLFTGRLLVHGGDGPQVGGSGTLYRKSSASNRGLVLLDNAGKTNGITEVDRDFTLAADLQIRAGATLATRFDTRTSTFRFQGNVTVETNGAISASGRGHLNGTGPGATARASCCTSGASHAGSGAPGSTDLPYGANYGSITEPSDPGSSAGDATSYGDGGDGGGSLRLIVDGSLQVDGRIESEGTAGGRYAGGGSGGSLWISSPGISGTGVLSVAGGSADLEGGGGGGGGRLAVYTRQNTFSGSLQLHGGNGFRTGGSGTAYLKLDNNPRGLVILDNGDRAGGFTEVSSTFSLPDDLVIRNGAILAPRLSGAPWNLYFPANVHIQAGGSISATARGFAGGQGEGSSPPVAAYSPGGSHGGKGGAGDDTLATTTHGDWFQPVVPGSGAGNATSYEAGGNGGGAIRLVVDGELRVDGRLEADGGLGGNYAGGGSGGSVYVTASQLTGSGRISATGGNASRNASGGGGGGGGRIALYYDAFDEALLDQMTTAGGDGIQQGGGGTIFLKGSTQPSGELIVDRSPLDKDTAPTEFWGPIQIPGSMRIRSGAIVSHPQGHPFQLGVRGDLTLASGAEIDLDGLGYPAKTGPGGTPDNAGASHGAAGGNARDGGIGGLAYGDAENPIDLGSGAGNRAGGGSARISVQGTLRLDGLVSANAAKSTSGGGASGGSILLHASRLTGRGFVLADGGGGDNNNTTGGGAGGRIALRHHGAAFPTNQVSALGGAGWRAGTNGTVHVRLLPDNEPPRLVSVIASPSMTEITASFSDVLDASTAEDITRYLLSGSARVLHAALLSDLSTVLLTTTPLTGGTTYTLTVSDVRNGLGLPVAGTSASASFIARGTLRGLARQEVYYGINGTRLSQLYADPRWPVSPDSTRDLTRLTAQRDDIDGDQLGAQLTGYVVPETTGWHRFYMTADDNGVLYLSEDHSPANVRLIASEPLLAYPGEWASSTRAEVTTSRGVPPANVSSPLWLVAGRHYWFDARFKEGTSTEHLAITWQAPGEPAPLPNEGTRLTGERIARPATDAGPQIVVQPVGGEFPAGSTATLRVQASGTGPLRFQWYRGGAPIPGETTDTLVLANLSNASFGTYRVRVTDSVGAVDSSLAVVQRLIPPEPVFSESPQGRTVALGENVLLNGLAEGTSPLHYQWRLNGQEIEGANGPFLSIPAMRRSDAGAYTLVVSNPFGIQESAPAVLSLAVPLIPLSDAFAQRQIFTQTNGIGATNNLVATREDASGEPRHVGKRGGRSLWLTWRAPTSGVVTFSTAGSSFDTLLAVYQGTALNALQPIASDEDSGGFLTSEARFNAVRGSDYHIAIDGFADAAGNIVLSWELDPSAAPLPVLLQQPAGALGVVGDAVQFTVAFTPPTATVQWFLNDRELSGETAATLRIQPVTPAQAGTYRARIRTPEGAVLESAGAVLEVTDRPQASGTLSADKLDDLFPEDAAALVSPRALQDSDLAAELPVSVGLPGSQWTDNSLSSRGGEDPELCQAFATATRWFRLRFNVPGAGATTVRLTTDGTALPSLVAVFTNRANLRMIACDAAQPPQKPGAAVQFGALRGVDYLVLVDGVQGRRGPIQLNWSAEEENPPQVTLRDGRFHVSMRVAPAVYDWQVAGNLGAWQTLLRTNLPSGVFEFQDSLPATEPSRFFRLIPATP